MAIVSVCIIVALCTYAFYLGHPEQAALIACTVIIGLVGAFAYSRTIDKDNEKK